MNDISKLVERSSKEMTNFTEEGRRYDNTKTFAIAPPPLYEDRKTFREKKKFFDTKFFSDGKKRAKSSFFQPIFKQTF